MLAFGRPAKVIRELTDDERRQVREPAEHYLQLLRDYTGGPVNPP